LEDAGSAVGFMQVIFHCLHGLNRIFSVQLIGFYLRATKPELKSSLKRPIYYVFEETQASAHFKYEPIHCSRKRNSSTLGWYSQVTQGAARRLHIGKANAVLREFCRSVVTNKTGAFTNRKAVSL